MMNRYAIFFHQLAEINTYCDFANFWSKNTDIFKWTKNGPCGTKKRRFAMKAERLDKQKERVRIDIDSTTKFIIDDLIERGYFKDQQMALAAAVNALQMQVAAQTYNNEYDDELTQSEMDQLQLGFR